MTTTAILCVILAAAPTAPIPKERTDAEKLVGKWKLVKSSNQTDGEVVDLVLELTASGKMFVRQTSNGVTSIYEGEYKLDKKELPYTLKLPGGLEKKETLKIKKLTELELHVVDPDDIQEDFERVKPEKKDE
ncbi:MAG: hypothetical protein K8U57_08030 [Planctomycetes bacterium]|nr:hypothetical protein [Planctomycetota bacterium]